jgi:hypothetical protein
MMGSWLWLTGGKGRPAGTRRAQNSLAGGQQQLPASALLSLCLTA